MNAEMKKQLEKTLQGFLEKNQVLKLNVQVGNDHIVCSSPSLSLLFSLSLFLSLSLPPPLPPSPSVCARVHECVWRFTSFKLAYIACIASKSTYMYSHKH